MLPTQGRGRSPRWSARVGTTFPHIRRSGLSGSLTPPARALTHIARMPSHPLTPVIASLALFVSAGPTIRAQAAPVTRAFTGFTLIDGTGRDPVPNTTLLVRSGRIVAVGPASRVRIPAGAERVPLDGKFVMPGLINGHGHATGIQDLATYAAYGVTTVFSLGDEPADVFAARDAQRNAPALSPPPLNAPPLHARVFLAGPVLTPS
jgi:hypothetical protein